MQIKERKVAIFVKPKTEIQKTDNKGEGGGCTSQKTETTQKTQPNRQTTSLPPLKYSYGPNKEPEWQATRSASESESESATESVATERAKAEIKVHPSRASVPLTFKKSEKTSSTNLNTSFFFF